MFKSPPQEKRWLSWLYVVVWFLFIFVTILLGRTIQQYVYQEWNRDLFLYLVLALTASGFVAAMICVRRIQPASCSGYIWLAAIASIFFVYTIELGKRSPEEALHFVQYGVLGILVYRALAHRIRDISIYFAVAIICGIFGVIDEFVQWLIPQRVWGMHDIWMNFFSAALVQTAIAKGLKPIFIAKRPSRENLRFTFCLTIVAVVIFGASLFFTPPRIAGLADRIGWLEGLKKNEGVMLEYGYLYEDPDIGVFRSRLAPHVLEQIDTRRAAEAADILDRFQDKSLYQAFLKTYTPINDPFVHEARVHLFRRDQYFGAAARYQDDPQAYARHLTVAFRENQIMEKYFHNTLRHSGYVWTEENLVLAHDHLLHEKIYNSRVSQSLITRVSEGQVACLFFIVLLGLVLLYGYLAKTCNVDSSLEH